MSFVNIAGWSVPVVRGSGRAGPVNLRGTAERVFNGNLQSSEHSPKRTYRLTAAFTNNDEMDAFLGAISVPGSEGVPTPVPISSPHDGLTRGETMFCHCRAGEAEAVYRQTAGLASVYWRIPLIVEEV